MSSAIVRPYSVSPQTATAVPTARLYSSFRSGADAPGRFVAEQSFRSLRCTMVTW